MCAPRRRTRTRGHNTAAAHCVKIAIFYESNKFLLYVIAFSIATVPYLEVWLKISGLSGRGLVWPACAGHISASPYLGVEKVSLGGACYPVVCRPGVLKLQ